MKRTLSEHLTAGQLESARGLFDRKQATLRNVAGYTARRCRLSYHEAEDFHAECVTCLFHTCCRWIREAREDEINCALIVRGVLVRRTFDRGRFPAARLAEDWDIAQAGEPEITVEAVTYTLSDLRMDRPAVLGFDDFCSLAEAAQALGVSGRRVRQLQHDRGLDGIKVGQRWRFPREKIEAERLARIR